MINPVTNAPKINTIVNLTKFDLESIWTIIGDEHSYCMIHDHTNISGISVVLYLQVPPIDPDDYYDKSRGQIYFVLDLFLPLVFLPAKECV